MTNNVLVYGTLRPGTGPTLLVPGYIHDLGWYPGFLPASPDVTDSRVTCEVVSVDDRKLAALDQYEGYSPDRPESSLYIRETVTVDDQKYFIYVYNDVMDDKAVVESGDWLQYTGETSGRNSHLARAA